MSGLVQEMEEKEGTFHTLEVLRNLEGGVVAVTWQIVEVLMILLCVERLMYLFESWVDLDREVLVCAELGRLAKVWSQHLVWLAVTTSLRVVGLCLWIRAAGIRCRREFLLWTLLEKLCLALPLVSMVLSLAAMVRTAMVMPTRGPAARILLQDETVFFALRRLQHRHKHLAQRMQILQLRADRREMRLYALEEPRLAATLLLVATLAGAATCFLVLRRVRRRHCALAAAEAVSRNLRSCIQPTMRLRRKSSMVADL